MPADQRFLAVLIGFVVVGGAEAPRDTQSENETPVTYRLSFPAPEHRWLEVAAVFPNVPAAPLELRMSRSSPGRYALHEFAKNVYDVRASDGRGRPLRLARSSPHQWDAAGHDGTVRMSYRVFGDRVDGTYLAVDTTHAHINMPATLMWARGLERRRVRLELVPPPGAAWKAATQLHPTDEPHTFTAPNLQYLMDSPIEFSAFSMRTFRVAASADSQGATVRIALHHDGAEGELDRLAGDVERIVREEGAVFGEFPAFDVGAYTVLADDLPHATGDGMEHRNSTVVTSAGALANPRRRTGLLATLAHEFFHSWNVERIRPRSLEPFDFEAANMSAELWLAEGFTSYYETLVMQRAGLADLAETVSELGRLVNAITHAPGRAIRSAEEMSRLASFVDAARSVDRTNWENTYLSYYTGGAAIGLGLDLALRGRRAGEASLDDFMRALWRRHGKPGGRIEGDVDAPYTARDARDRLAEVSDESFADEFFRRYIQGREIVDYGSLLARAGLVLRRQNPGRAWIGDVRLASGAAGARVDAPVPFGSPAYEAGLERDDQVVSLGGEPLSSAERLETFLGRRRPGDRVTATFIRRGERVSSPLVLEEDPRLEVVPAESIGRALREDERRFREAWLGSQVGRDGLPQRR